MRRVRAGICALVGVALIALLALTGPVLAVDADLRRLARSDDSDDRRAAAKRLAVEGTTAAVKLLRTLITDEDAEVRDWSVQYCANLKDGAAISALAPLTRSRQEWVRRNAASALGRTRSPFAAPLLETLSLTDASTSVRAEAMAWLVKLKEHADVDAVLVKAFEHRRPGVRAAAVVAQDELRGPSAGSMARAACDDSDEGVRCVGSWLLRRIDPEALRRRLDAVHDDDGWRSRVQRAENATLLRTREALDVLVELVGDDNPRVAASAHRGLRRLSGTRLGRDRDLWAAWWRENRAGWKRPAEMPPEVAIEPGETFTKYHGIEVDSAGALFVLDGSTSMLKRPDRKATAGPTRWDLASAELLSTLDRLPDGMPVNVAVFHDGAKAAFPAPRALGKSTRKALRTFIERADFDAATDLFAALRMALAMDGIDSVFILSDGVPTDGEMVHKGRISPVFWRANLTRKLAVHTIAFAAGEYGGDLLQRLARYNSGRYVEK